MVPRMSRSVIVMMVLAFMLGVADAQRCPTVSLMPKFETNKYMGVWYEIQSQPSIFQNIKKCLKTNYRRTGKNTVVIASQGKTAYDRPASSMYSMTITQDNPARMITTDFIAGYEPPYEVIDTDYKTYSCVHTCLNVGIFGINDYVFIFSRTRTLSQDKINHCRRLFSKYDQVNLSTLKNTEQTNCA